MCAAATAPDATGQGMDDQEGSVSIFKRLQNFEWRAGDLAKVADPEVWLRLTKKFWFQGNNEEGGKWLRINCVVDAMRSTAIPQLIFAQQFAPGRRLVGKVDMYNDSISAFVGQRLPLLDLKGTKGFKRCKVNPELQLGIDASLGEPTINVSMNDDDYSGLAFDPITHPAVLASGAGLVAAMVKWRFPLSTSLKLWARKSPDGEMTTQVNLFQRTQREGAKALTTTNLYGVMLTLCI